MVMTAEAKSALSKTIRGLRARLLRDLHDETEATYRLSMRAQEAKLDETRRVRRRRLETWLAEQVRAQAGSKAKARRGIEDFRREAEQQAAYTLLNRLVMLRLLEAPPSSDAGPGRTPLRTTAIVTGGWESAGYKHFRELAPALVRGDATEGYAQLLALAFEDLATELPGVFGGAGIAELIPIPAATLRHVVEALDQPVLATCWRDDMTLGWVYQYWNDPQREALDAKIHPKTRWGSGKIEPHEIASKTQMFTERYMVDWLLQNSLGPLWLAMCKQNGWTPEAEADGTLAALEARRAEWRAQRAAGPEHGGVALTDLMPLHTAAERRWAYYVPQPIPDAAVAKAPASVRDLKLLDPAVGSGHFLVVAFELLFALYQEEARHRGHGNIGQSAGGSESDRDGEARASDGHAEADDASAWRPEAIVSRILSHNLHGIDLDPRAVQIAAAALWLKAQQLCPGARPERLNLVASNLNLASLPDDDPALVELRAEVARDTGIPGALTNTLVHALRGADHLGSLLKVDAAVDDALAAALRESEAPLDPKQRAQGNLFGGFRPAPARVNSDPAATKATLLKRLERFLAKHSGGDDLGLRLRGEQLAAGVRFVRMVRESTYDLVVANPPYQGTAKMADTSYIEKTYPLGEADLYAAFLLRGLELVRDGGVSAMLTMRSWMFVKQYADLREHLLATHRLRALGDFEVGAFEHVDGMVVSVCVNIFQKTKAREESVALKLTIADDDGSSERTRRKRAATLCHEGRVTFEPEALRVVPKWPLVYWWDAAQLRTYQSAPLIGTVSPARAAQSTGDNERFVRLAWEVSRRAVRFSEYPTAWFPFINGGKGREWWEELRHLVNWAGGGLPIKSSKCHKTGSETCTLASEEFFCCARGVAFSMIGANFAARVHRYPSILGNKGSSIFPSDLATAVCSMNSTRARNILSSLNPGVGFEVGDVNRLPLFPIEGAATIFAQVESAFGVHEAHREPSVEFKHPGPSPWRYAQAWAQTAVDRSEGEPLPPYVEAPDPEPATDHLSFALGIALGRFLSPSAQAATGSATANAERADNGDSQAGLAAAISASAIADPVTADLSYALPAGILFLDTTLAAEDRRDGLGHPAAAPLYAAWAQHGSGVLEMNAKSSKGRKRAKPSAELTRHRSASRRRKRSRAPHGPRPRPQAHPRNAHPRARPLVRAPRRSLGNGTTPRRETRRRLPPPRPRRTPSPRPLRSRPPRAGEGSQATPTTPNADTRPLQRVRANQR